MQQQKFEGTVGAVTSGTIEIQQQNLVVLHASPPANDSDDNSSVRAWREFVDLTKIPASAPACRLLRVLLETEDVTPRQIKRIWGSELTFHQAIGLQVAIPRRPYLAIAVMGILALAGCGLNLVQFILRDNPALYSTALALCAFFLGGFFWVSIDLLLPYKISKRLAPMVRRVNAGVGLKGDDK